MNCTEPDFWEHRYRHDKTPWDMRGVPAPLLAYLEEGAVTGRALIPGCGSGYELRAFHDAGWNVAAVDFAPSAVERARKAAKDLAEAVHLADFFTNDMGGPYDLIYERTFLCSLPPERWADYVRRMAELLKPNGRLAGLFFYGEESEPPPFPMTRSGAFELFGRDFMLAEDRGIPAEESLPIFAGQERWQVWRRKG